jgi:hypothetical protein
MAKAPLRSRALLGCLFGSILALLSSMAVGLASEARALPAQVIPAPSRESRRIVSDAESLDASADNPAPDGVELSFGPNDEEVLGDAILEVDPMVDHVEPTGTDSDSEPLDRPFSYNAAQSSTAWLPGGDDEFGIVSLENLGVIGVGQPSGMAAGFGVHFLDGPVRTEMPPRLFDFSMGYQRREWLWPDIGWDFLFRVGAYSDFEGSAKDGVRFPGHAVTFLRLTPSLTWLLGIDYLDRDDISLLPVFGAAWSPSDDVRLDLAFPRPSLAVRVMDSTTWLYLAGELGGGTWAIERDEAWDDNATYRDLRLVFGIETLEQDGSGSALELGYVFDRELEYRSGLGDYSPEDCLMIRLVGRY